MNAEQTKRTQLVHWVIPIEFLASLEDERKKLGLKSVSEVARSRMGCPNPGDPSWPGTEKDLGLAE